MDHINFVFEDSSEPKDSGLSEIKEEFSPTKKENLNDETKEYSKLEENCIVDVIEWLSNEEKFSHAKLKEWKLENLARLASNFSKYPDGALSKHVIKNIVIVIEEKVSRGAKLDKQMLCSFAKLFIDRRDESWSCNLMQTIAAEFLSARSKDEKFSMQELSKLAIGFGYWPDQECCQKAMKEISSIIQEDLPTAEFTEEEVSEFALALVNWSNKDWIEDTMKVISNAAKKKIMDGKRFTKNGLSKLAVAFSKWHDKVWSFEVVRIIALNNIAAFGAGLNFTKEELAQFAIAFSEFADRNSSNIYNVMEWTYYQYYLCKEEFTLKQLCNLAIAFGKWPQEIWSLTVAREVLENFDIKSYSNLDLNVQEKCDISNVLGGLSYRKLSKGEKMVLHLLAPRSTRETTNFRTFFGKISTNLKQKSSKLMI